MDELAKEILPVNIEDRLKQSYLDYVVSVIIGRALPDARDGLKPAHRRVPYTMSELGNDWNKPYKKSAHVVGDVIDKCHPHDDTVVHDAIVHMVQSLLLRYTLVGGQDNLGSVDGDNATAMQYAEVRVAKLAHELPADLEKEAVNWVPNYDGTEQILVVMSAKIPNLLVNGSSSITVGMATSIPPYNLDEAIDGCLVLMDNLDLTVDELIQYISDPDFPTVGIISGRAGVIEAYRTSRGCIYIRARAAVRGVEKGGGHEQIITAELPCQLNKARLIEKIAELVKEKKTEGISELRDESDKDGMRVVIELRCSEVGEVVPNNLYTQTQLQSVFGINVAVLADGQPCTLNLKGMLEMFVRHRHETVTRRTVYEPHKARERGHILGGQAVVLSSIDPVIEPVKSSPTPTGAKERLIATAWESSAVEAMVEHAGANTCRPEDLGPQYGLRDSKYYLSPEQAQVIPELRLHRLTDLEHEKLFSRYQEILNLIGELIRILTDPARLVEVIREELEAVKTEFGDVRRTEIVVSQIDLTIADLITEEDRVVTISHDSYAESQPLAVYQTRRRGGKGKSVTGTKDEDYIEHLLVANSHTTLLLLSSKSKVYWLCTFKISEALRTVRGRPPVSLPPLDEGKRITAMLQIDLEVLQQSGGTDDDLDEVEGTVLEDEVVRAAEAEEVEGETVELVAEPTSAYVFMVTTFGTMKKTPLAQSNRPRSGGPVTFKLEGGDTLIAVVITDGAREVMLFSSAGKVIHFAKNVVRTMSRNVHGVRGIRLGKRQQLIFIPILKSGAQILTASKRGFGKRTPLSEFPHRSRSDQGVIAMVTSERSGTLIAMVQVQEGEETMPISDQGILARTRVDEASLSGRNTQGVALTKLASDEILVDLERVQGPSSGDSENLSEGEETARSLGDSAEPESEPAAKVKGNEE